MQNVAARGKRIEDRTSHSFPFCLAAFLFSVRSVPSLAPSVGRMLTVGALWFRISLRVDEFGCPFKLLVLLGTSFEGLLPACGERWRELFLTRRRSARTLTYVPLPSPLARPISFLFSLERSTWPLRPRSCWRASPR